MKILHAIDKMDPKRGGVCQAVRTIISGLEDMGIENEVVSLDAPGEKFLLNEIFTVHALGPSNNYWSFSRKLIPWLLKNFSGYDAVIVHGLWQYPTYAFIRVKKQLEKNISFSKKIPKLYIMPHGMLDPYFQTASGRRLKAIRNTIYWQLLEKKSVNNADGIFFTCETECILARVPFKPYHPKQELVVGLGVEVPPVYSEEMKTSFLLQCNGIKDQDYLLFLSRIHEKKGVDLLLKAYEKLILAEGKSEKSSRGIRDFSCGLPKLVVAGPNLESDYGKRIQQMVDDSSILKENVLFPGMLSGDAKWGAFYGCEAFVLPSHQENFGIAIVEAMACGKPVLTTNKVNIWREIEGAGAGFISADTFEGIYSSLMFWSPLEKEDKLEIGVKAMQCFEKNFAVDSASKRLLKELSA